MRRERFHEVARQKRRDRVPAPFVKFETTFTEQQAQTNISHVIVSNRDRIRRHFPRNGRTGFARRLLSLTIYRPLIGQPTWAVLSTGPPSFHRG
ncbi:hypothetical protein IAQ61_008825 [Plenodomus lingam]|uniref:uncharacterized protein n=1 Tax=Leptosphaeria maculans TaxID=5022 RepID=UPI003319A72A|nr:hypothetical protein IAQ61_008825 [Plenodomus lingam]